MFFAYINQKDKGGQGIINMKYITFKKLSLYSGYLKLKNKIYLFFPFLTMFRKHFFKSNFYLFQF